jgi:hypothetical protein
VKTLEFLPVARLGPKKALKFTKTRETRNEMRDDKISKKSEKSTPNKRKTATGPCEISVSVRN